MIRGLVGLMLLLWIPAAPAADSKYCTAGAMFLEAGKSNTCLHSILNGMTNPSEKRRLYQVIGRWNPPQDLSMQAIPGGYRLFRKEKLVSEAIWLKSRPYLLYWDGAIYEGSKTGEESLMQFLDATFERTRRTRSRASKKTAPHRFPTFFILPEASAAPSQDDMNKDFLVLFSFQQNAKLQSALEVVASTSKSALNDYFPPMHFTDRLWGGLEVQCSKHGVQSLKYDYTRYFDSDSYDPIKGRLKSNSLDGLGIDTNRPRFKVNERLEIRSGPDSTYFISGLIPGKTIKVHYAISKWERCVSYTGDRQDDSRFCQPMWKKFFKENPQIEAEYERWRSSSSNQFALLTCDVLYSRASRAKCEDHWKKADATSGSIVKTKVGPDCTKLSSQQSIDTCLTYWKNLSGESGAKAYEEPFQFERKHASKNKIGSFAFEICENASCTETTKGTTQGLSSLIDPEGEANLRAVLKADSEKARQSYVSALKRAGAKIELSDCTANSCPSPSDLGFSSKSFKAPGKIYDSYFKARHEMKTSQEQIDQHLNRTDREIEQNIVKMMAGAKVLGECCQTDECRTMAISQRLIHLQPTRPTQ